MAVIIVDGYNMIGQWPPLSALRDEALELARTALLDLLADYARASGHDVTVVFDADRAPEPETRLDYHGLSVVYTAYGETADAWIEKAVRQNRGERAAEELYVATSDRLVALSALGGGARRISADELWRDVMGLRREVRAAIEARSRGRERPALWMRLPEDVRMFFEKYRRQ
ncbi:MAG: NYN domain-containing protein [Hydrogenibacillus sp.]|nr:NYN domain-containing protein [Hydrogenibacillus sp.]